MEQLRDFLITDRTEKDVERARYLLRLWDPAARRWRGTPEELAEWEAGPKGLYNAKDLNRVALAASYVLTRLAAQGYTVPADGRPAYLAAVSVDPPGSGRAQGALFYAGDWAEVRAEPVGGSRFLYWTENGEAVSEDPVYTFTAEASRSLTACFEAASGAERIGKAE